jgi:hypothetical protein
MRMSFVLVVVVLAAMALETDVASGMALARTQQSAVPQTCERSGDDDQHQQPMVDSTLGESTIFQPGASRRLRAGEPPPLLLMFGAIPQDAPIWNPVTAACAGSCMPTTLARL